MSTSLNDIMKKLNLSLNFTKKDKDPNSSKLDSPRDNTILTPRGGKLDKLLGEQFKELKGSESSHTDSPRGKTSEFGKVSGGATYIAEQKEPSEQNLLGDEIDDLEVTEKKLNNILNFLIKDIQTEEDVEKIEKVISSLYLLESETLPTEKNHKVLMEIYLLLAYLHEIKAKKYYQKVIENIVFDSEIEFSYTFRCIAQKIHQEKWERPLVLEELYKILNQTFPKIFTDFSYFKKINQRLGHTSKPSSSSDEKSLLSILEKCQYNFQRINETEIETLLAPLNLALKEEERKAPQQRDIDSINKANFLLGYPPGNISQKYYTKFIASLIKSSYAVETLNVTNIIENKVREGWASSILLPVFLKKADIEVTTTFGESPLIKVKEKSREQEKEPDYITVPIFKK